MRTLTLDDCIFVLENCTKKNDSKCNLCILNDEYGDACIDIKDQNVLRILKEVEANKDLKKRR